MFTTDQLQPIVELGFTNLEAETYLFLLQESPATGYRIAQALGKPVANTYKAIQSLQIKGAIEVDDGENRQCRAVPADQLLSQLDRAFQSRRTRAAQAFAAIKRDTLDCRVYQIRSFEHLMERARQMLARAEKTALLDIFPGPLRELRGDIEAAASRGVHILVQVYEPAELAGCEVVACPARSNVISKWPGEHLNVVIDAREHLAALLARGEKRVIQATYTGSPFLCCIQHGVLASDVILAKIREELNAAPNIEQLRTSIHNLIETIRLSNVPGFADFCNLDVAAAGPNPLAANRRKSRSEPISRGE